VLQGHLGDHERGVLPTDCGHTASSDNTAKLWDAQTGKEILTLAATSRKSLVTLSPDGSYVSPPAVTASYRLVGLDWREEAEHKPAARASNLLSLPPGEGRVREPYELTSACSFAATTLR
jgi:WD40 repeat protein